ncbi:MAG: T9SS type A sorting domain-containing protein, partial [Bacteroidota bacterium]
NVYPNPTNSFVHFDRLESGYISTLDGRLVHSFVNQRALDISFLPTGTYLLHFNGGTSRVVKI